VATGDKRVYRDFAEASEPDVGPEFPTSKEFEEHSRDEVSLSRSLHGPAKRVLDVVGSLLLALVFSPLIVAIPFMMRRDGGGVIYKHRRVGHNGRMFECLKFRTMVPNADEVLCQLLVERPEMKAEWLRDRKLRHDPRVTRL